MCARKPAQLHQKQPSNISSTSLQNHHHHHLATGVVQLIPGSTSLVTRLETLRKHRRQLSPILRVNLRQVWSPPTRNMDMSNEINENLSNEMAEVKGCLHRPLCSSSNISPAKSSSPIICTRDENS